MLKSNQCQVFVCPSEIMAALARDETCCICYCQKSNCCWLGFFFPSHLVCIFSFPFLFFLFCMRSFMFGTNRCTAETEHQVGALESSRRLRIELPIVTAVAVLSALGRLGDLGWRAGRCWTLLNAYSRLSLSDI